MKYRYTKFTGDALDELDLEDLVAKLSDLLLSSGFGNPYGGDEEERTLQALHDAILDALFNGGVLPEETIERLLGDPADADQAEARSMLEDLIQQIIEKMTQEGYISMPPDLEAERERRAKIVAAEGEFQAAVKLGEAADIITAHPVALQLRTLQTMAEISVEKNSTIIFPAQFMTTVQEAVALMSKDSASK